MNNEKDRLPKSASSFFINLFGGICFIIAVFFVLNLNPQADVLLLIIFGIIAAILPIVFFEIFILRVHKRKSTGLLSQKAKAQKGRVAIKLLGYYGSLGFVMLLYFLIPMYSDDTFYESSFILLLPLLLTYMVFGGLYISEMDRWLEEPEDALWHTGKFLSGAWKNVNFEILKSHLRSVLLRGYFLPVMLTYMVINIQSMMQGQDKFLETYMVHLPHESSALIIIKFLVTVYFYLACIDVLFALIGYIMTLRILDSHIRSTEPTFLGWLVCLVCYFPFWELLVLKIFFIDFYQNPQWSEWFSGMPVALVIFWGALVIIGMCLEALTTLTFGVRFSNLTYRGLITEGPFRFTKHPQYIFKMMNRFCYFVPFLSLYGLVGVTHNLILFFGICFIYYLRARTEENHLSRYPEYIEYANWINRNGIFKDLCKYLPFLIFSEEKAKAGRLF